MSIETIELRKCSQCNIEKSLSEFNKRKYTASGINGKCKLCTREYMKKYNSSRKDIPYYKTWKEGHKVCGICERELPFESFHKAKAGHFGLKGNCKECEQKRNREYRQKTKWDSKYKKRRRNTDINFKLRYALRGRLIDALKRHTSGGTVNKRHSALILLGCTIPDLMNHLKCKFQKGMSWENHGTVWEIDHIKPCASFDLTDSEQQKACFHYTNLQPLTIFQNRSKRDK